MFSQAPNTAGVNIWADLRSRRGVVSCESAELRQTWNSVFRRPYWGLWTRVANKTASLCQSDLDPPGSRGLFDFLLMKFQTAKFLMVCHVREQDFSVSQKAVVMQGRGWFWHFSCSCPGGEYCFVVTLYLCLSSQPYECQRVFSWSELILLSHPLWLSLSQFCLTYSLPTVLRLSWSKSQTGSDF